MAETKKTNVIIPEVFSDYTMEVSKYKNRYIQSEIMVANPGMNKLLAGGGTTFPMPFWQDLDDTESSVPSETVAVTVGNITSAQQEFRRLTRNRAWGSNTLAKIYSGDDPLAAIADYVIGYWMRDHNKTLVSSTLGVLADNIANDAGDLVKDNSLVNFSDDGVIDAQGLLGENGTVGAQDNESYVGMAVHPLVYDYMRKLDLVDFVAISGQTRPLMFYMGMEVISDRRMPVATGVYTTVIYKKGAFQFGQDSTRYMPTEVDRDPSKGFGIDNLYTRRQLAIHPVGFKWLSTTTAGDSPTNTEIELATNWDRVYDKENIRMVFLKHKLP